MRAESCKTMNNRVNRFPHECFFKWLKKWFYPGPKTITIKGHDVWEYGQGFSFFLI
jgi:hypothetical protein